MLQIGLAGCRLANTLARLESKIDNFSNLLLVKDKLQIPDTTEKGDKSPILNSISNGDNIVFPEPNSLVTEIVDTTSENSTVNDKQP